MVGSDPTAAVETCESALREVYMQCFKDLLMLIDEITQREISKASPRQFQLLDQVNGELTSASIVVLPALLKKWSVEESLLSNQIALCDPGNFASKTGNLKYNAQEAQLTIKGNDFSLKEEEGLRLFFEFLLKSRHIVAFSKIRKAHPEHEFDTSTRLKNRLNGMVKSKLVISDSNGYQINPEYLQ